MNLENKKQLVTILLAVGLGLAAAFLMSQYVQNNIKQQTKELAEAYSKRNQGLVNEIDTLTRELKQMKAQQVALQRSQEELRRQKPQQVVITRTPQGTEVVDTTVFSDLTPPGKRALTIMIDSLSAVGGLVNPGDFVDVIATLAVPHPTDPEADKDDVTTMLFQNIQVLAVGVNFKPVGNALIYEAQTKARSLNITLAVSPEEAGLLSFAQSNGKLQLALRPSTELSTEFMQTSSWGALSDYLYNRQGTELAVPSSEPASIRQSGDSSSTEVKPFIEIFRGGREL